MSMRSYGMCYCTIPDEKLREICTEKYDYFIKFTEKLNVCMVDMARAFSWDDDEPILDAIDIDVAMEYYGTDDEYEAQENALKDIWAAFSNISEEYKSKTGYSLEIVRPDGDSDAEAEYYWVTDFVLARKLRDIGAQVVSWVEWG